MSEELHLTKKDFRVDWFSGSGAGGQHRNKHQNCCRITHTDTGISAVGTASRSRVDNQREAFTKLAVRLLAEILPESDRERLRGTETIRTYHAERNEVKDHRTGRRESFSDVVEKNKLDKFLGKR